MLNICFKITTPEPVYAYKRHAHKKKTCKRVYPTMFRGLENFEKLTSARCWGGGGGRGGRRLFGTRE